MGTFQKFQNSLRNVYFSPLYILIYKIHQDAFDIIFLGDIVAWCYYLLHSVAPEPEQSYCIEKFELESVVDVYAAYHMFPFYVENNVSTIQGIALLIFRQQNSKYYFIICQITIICCTFAFHIHWVFPGKYLPYLYCCTHTIYLCKGDCPCVLTDFFAAMMKMPPIYMHWIRCYTVAYRNIYLPFICLGVKWY